MSIPPRKWCDRCGKEMMAFENPDNTISYVCVNRNCGR